MSPNRKADLQRKLAMAPIPKPPAGLAERIKSDIPQHLLVDARKERERLSRSVSFNLRVAASVILLIGSVYLALRFLTVAEHERNAEFPPVTLARKAPAAPPPASPARVAETTAPPVEIPKSMPAPVPVPTPRPSDDRKQLIIAEAKPEPLAKEERQRRNEAGGRSADYSAAPAEPMAAPAPPPPQPAAPSTMTMDGINTAAEAAPRAQAKMSTGIVASAVAESITLTPSSLFGIVIPQTGGEVRGPALIQRFAAPDAPPRAIRLTGEATTLGNTPLLRVSVDVPAVPHPEGGSLPPVGANATLDIAFNDDAVASHRAIAGEMTSNASALPSGMSVTALFAIELKPGVARRATLATVKLRYRSVADGKEHTLPLKLRRDDLRDWENGSKRMKSTALAAALVESLEPRETIAEKARAAGLDELASLAAENR